MTAEDHWSVLGNSLVSVCIHTITRSQLPNSNYYWLINPLILNPKLSGPDLEVDEAQAGFDTTSSVPATDSGISVSGASDEFPYADLATIDRQIFYIFCGYVHQIERN